MRRYLKAGLYFFIIYRYHLVYIIREDDDDYDSDAISSLFYLTISSFSGGAGI